MTQNESDVNELSIYLSRVQRKKRLLNNKQWVFSLINLFKEYESE